MPGGRRPEWLRGACSGRSTGGEHRPRRRDGTRSSCVGDRADIGLGPETVQVLFEQLLPLGNERLGRGNGGLGFQVNLPLSLVLSPRLTTHWNAGATLVPSAGNESGRATTFGPNVGGSVVWSFSPKFDALVEAVWMNQESVVGEGRTSRESIALLSPGIRIAWEVANGVELVPGAAYTLNLSGPTGNDAIFLYLSIEHLFQHQ